MGDVQGVRLPHSVGDHRCAAAATVQPKNLNRDAFGRALRVLNRRCVDDGHKVKLRDAVKKWVDNRGNLPDGLSMSPGDGELQVAADAVETASVIPHHKVLLSTFELKSKAFMLTYNSRGAARLMGPTL